MSLHKTAMAFLDPAPQVSYWQAWSKEMGSWSEPYREIADPYWNWAQRSTPHSGGSFAWRAVSSVQERATPLQDAQVTSYAVARMAALAKKTTPWALFVGLHKPHLPFIAPQRHFDRYPLDGIRLAHAPWCPWKLPGLSFSSYELQEFVDVGSWWQMHGRQQCDGKSYRRGCSYAPACNETIPDATARQLRRAYYAAVSFADELFGRLVAGLKRVGAWDSTVVLLWGDHGFKLGEHGGWAKHDNTLVDTRIPLILRVPSISGRGVAHGLVEVHADSPPSRRSPVPTISLNLAFRLGY